jgi:glycerophosphoryl diester phosphodiesterase
MPSEANGTVHPTGSPRREGYGAGVARHRVLVSAHRCGYAELGTVGGHEDPLAGVLHSARVGADFCEFDVRRCVDGTFVVSHDADGGTGDESVAIADLAWPELRARAAGVCTLDDLLTAVVSSGLGAHVDLKLRTPSKERKAGAAWEVEAVAAVAARLDPSRIVVTTGLQNTTTGLRAWAAERDVALVVALSIGGSVRGLSWRNALRTRWGELFPQLRFRQSQADAVAAHFALAMIRLSRWTTHIGVPLLVWTVDSPWLQKRFLHDRRIWMITTNRPAQAVALRDRPRPRRWLA